MIAQLNRIMNIEAEAAVARGDVSATFAINGFITFISQMNEVQNTNQSRDDPEMKLQETRQKGVALYRTHRENEKRLV